MKKEVMELLEFLCGLIMLIVGLFLFTGKVSVQSTMFYGTLTIGNFSFNSGLVLIPFGVGVVMLFFRPRMFAAKLITGLGLLLIVVTLILSTTLWIQRITLTDWIIYAVLIFGGLGLLCAALFTRHGKGKRGRDEDE